MIISDTPQKLDNTPYIIIYDKNLWECQIPPKNFKGGLISLNLDKALSMYNEAYKWIWGPLKQNAG